MSGKNEVEIRVGVKVDGSDQLQNVSSGLTKLGEQARASGAGAASGAAGLNAMGQAAGLAAGKADSAADALARTGAAGQQAEAGVGATRRGLQSISTQLEATQKSLTALRDSIVSAFAVKELIQAAAQVESVSAGLQAVSGDAALAGEQMDFVRRMANAAGVDVVDAGRAFLGLAAATKGTAVEGEPARQVFEAVTVAMARAGKSSAETQNALLALSQMASKGTVSMEELRGQLGEALPGALQAAANGLGVTTQDLIKLVETGSVAAEDLFPALAKGLNDLYAGAPKSQTLAQELVNVKNALVEMASQVGEAGGLDALKVAAETAQTAVVYLTDTLLVAGKTVGTLAAAVATLDFSNMKEALADIERESRERLLKAAAHNDVMRKAIEFSGSAALRAAVAAQAHGRAAEQAGIQAEQAGKQAESGAGGWVSLSNSYKKVKEEIEGQIDQAQKALSAREAEQKQVVEQAKVLGTEAEKRAAAVQAAQAHADASQRVAELKRAEVAALQAELTAKQALLSQAGPQSQNRKDEIKALEDLIGKKAQETAQSTAQAAGARTAADAARLASEIWKDNSDRLDELRQAYLAAREAAAQLRREKEAGRADAESAAQADRKAMEAAVLYRDALADVTSQLKAKADVQAAQIGLEEASLRVMLADQQARLEIARAVGDESAVMTAQNEIRRLEIELLRLSATAKRAEADAQITVAKAKLAELEASGELTPVKRLEIDASIKKAEVMRKEAEIADIAADKMQTLADLNQRAGKAAKDAVGGFDAAAAGLERMADASERAAAAERKRLNIDKEGFTLDKAGNRLVAGSELGTLTGVANFLRQAGLSEAQAKAVALEFSDGMGNVPYLNNPGQVKYGGRDSSLSQALLKAAERTTFGLDAVPEGGRRPASATGTSHVVTINLTGRAPVQIGMASDRDAQALTAWLRELQAAAARSSA